MNWIKLQHKVVFKLCFVFTGKRRPLKHLEKTSTMKKWTNCGGATISRDQPPWT